MKNEMYFRLELTENEHSCVEMKIQDFCVANNHELELVYYRKIKTGHIPMIREIKVRGQHIGKFKGFLLEEGLDKFVVPND